MSVRRIRRLHVRASIEDDARHAATLLTDAFHTASLPLADQGRLIVIRRLALGRLSARVSPGSLALHIERITRDAAADAVAYDLPAAADANVVAFPDRADAIVALARLHGRSAPADDWFWSDVVPGWRSDASRDARWSLLLDAAHQMPEAGVVAAAVVDQAIRAGTEGGLLSSVSSGQGAEWLRLEGWSNTAPGLEPLLRQSLNARRADIVERWRRQWGPTDDRLIWLCTMLAVQEKPVLVADPRLPARIAGWLLDAFEREASPQSTGRTTRKPTPNQIDDSPCARTACDGPDRPEDVVGRPRSDRSSDIDPSLKEGEALQSTDPDRPVSFDSASRDTALTGERGRFDRPQREDDAGQLHVDIEPEPVERTRLTGAFTPCAGLFFLVPILERLAFAKFLAASPELLTIDFPARLLWFIGQRVGLTADDPLAAVFHHEQMDDVDDSLFIAWTTAVRRWCRRHARQGLTTLIRRPGRVHISRTHIDVSFTLAQIDVRLRRLALDVDPGWVPWMGRVVQFSYRADHIN